MIKYATVVQLRLAAWRQAARERFGDERGAITTEAVIITAILGAVALGFAVWLTGVIEVWGGEVPEGPGDDPGFSPG